MIDVKVEPHREGAMAGKYDIRASDPNGNLLVYSHQGYSNPSDAVDIARRLFGDPAGQKLREIRQIIADADADRTSTVLSLVTLSKIRDVLEAADEKPEHVDLTVVSWEGTGRTEPIR